MTSFLQRVHISTCLAIKFNTYRCQNCFSSSREQVFSKTITLRASKHNAHHKYLCNRHLHWSRCAGLNYRMILKRSNISVSVTPCLSHNNSTFTLKNELFKSYVEHLEEEYEKRQSADGSKPSEDRLEALRHIVTLLNEARAKYSEMEELTEMENGI